jgi:hypothetical protein
MPTFIAKITIGVASCVLPVWAGLRPAGRPEQAVIALLRNAASRLKGRYAENAT